jgi:hypothetical protein
MPHDEPMVETLRKYAYDRDRDVMRLEAENAELRKQLAVPPEKRPAPSLPATDTSLHQMLEEHLR